MVGWVGWRGRKGRDGKGREGRKAIEWTDGGREAGTMRERCGNDAGGKREFSRARQVDWNIYRNIYT
jgi:hypothetical protein